MTDACPQTCGSQQASELAASPTEARGEARSVFPSLMDIGEALLKCGADVHFTEQMLLRLGKAYGATRMNVLVITAVIVMTASYPDGSEQTFSRRVVGEGGTDFAKLEALSRLCEECCEHPMTASEIASRLAAIKRERFPNAALFVGGVLSSSGFAVYFGGTLIDGAVSAAFALAVCLAIKYFKPLTPNTIIFNFATSFVVGVAICLAASVAPFFNVNIVIIGVIMLLIPGLAMTNATRDMLSGDTISGVMRFVESLLWATVLALGFMAALWAASELGWGYEQVTATMDWSFWMMLVAVTAGSVGFALFFDVRPAHILTAAAGGMMCWVIFFVSRALLSGLFVPSLIASTCAAIYAEVMARTSKIPNAVFFIIAVIPLVPGRGLYYTMYSAVNADWAACASNGLSTLLYAGGVAVGICLIAGIMQIWDARRAVLEK